LVAGGTGKNGGTIMQYADGTGPIYHPANVNFKGYYVYSDESETVYGPSSPQLPVTTNTVAWSGGPTQRCDATQASIGVHLPVPANALFMDYLNTTPNSCGDVLEVDRQTLWPSQPMQICTEGGPITTEYLFPATSIFGTDPSGSHGGSGLSSIGGTIKYNELIPGNSPIVNGVGDVIRHALGLATQSAFSAFGQGLWPATNHDTGNEGVFLALLPTFDYNSLQTPVGRSIAWTLINYGAYIDDDTGWNAVALNTDKEYNDSSVDFPGYPGPARALDQISSLFGVNFSDDSVVIGSGTVGQDFQTIFSSVYVIVNNAASLPAGGPGSHGRLQPLLPNPPVDPGPLASVPVIPASTFQLSASSLAAGTYVGTATGTNYPFRWSLSGTNAAYFNIGTFTGAIVLSTAGASAIAPGQTYVLTVTGTNVVGASTGTVTIKT
jgi:hypothetical protein